MKSQWRIIDVERHRRAELRRTRAQRSVVTPASVSERLAAALPQDIERVIDSNDLLNVNWLSIGARVARSVAKIEGAGPGTGFLVSHDLLLTTHHVLKRPEIAERSRAVFNAELDEDGLSKAPIPVRLRPDRLFVTSRSLDFTLVAIHRSSKSDAFGYSKLVQAEGKVVIGERVSIIQHPTREGGHKQIALRANKIVQIRRHVIRYETDTDSGSSGSPVYSTDWEVVAVHRRGVHARDSQGRPLTKDQEVAQEGTDDADFDWLYNEGARISCVMNVIRRSKLRKPAAILRDELLALGED